jgi:hypothetical protein
VELPHPAGLDYMPFQKAGIRYALERQGVLIADEMGLGKAQPLSAKLLTPSGWKTMGDISKGDYVFGSDGKPYRVEGVYPRGVRSVYRVTFSDGATTECCLEHLWQVTTPLRKWQGYERKVVELGEIKDKLQDPDGNNE